MRLNNVKHENIESLTLISNQFHQLPQYLTVSQVASLLQVSKDYVRALVKKGTLNTIKLPGGRNGPIRISLESLQKTLSDCTVTKNLCLKNSSHKSRRRKVYRGVFSV